MLSDIRTYLRLLKMNMVAEVEYKGWWLRLPQVMLNVITDPIGTLLIFSRFGSIGPWNMERILLIYAMAVTSFGLAESLCRGFDYFPWRMVRDGGFDRLLLRPRSLVFQVAGSTFHIHRLARVFTGLFMVFWSLSRLGVPLTAGRLSLLAAALLGGLLTYCGVFVLTSGLSFFTVRGLDWIYILTNASYQVTRCPMPYMPRLLKGVFTFFLPILLISYYPASVICGWGEPLYRGLLALPAGALFLFATLFVWRFGVRHYTSTGS